MFEAGIFGSEMVQHEIVFSAGGYFQSFFDREAKFDA
jgi:hypothetical protein